MQPLYIIPSSTLAGAAAFAGKEEKDAHHQADVETDLAWSPSPELLIVATGRTLGL